MISGKLEKMSRKWQSFNLIVHYNRSTPFRSVTQSPRAQWTDIVQQLTEENSWGIQRFADPEYLERRFSVEQQLRTEFVAKGGLPQLNHPIYFFFGRNNRFEELKSNIGYGLELKDVASSSISFTYGDSMLAFDQTYRIQSGEKYQSPLIGDLLRLEDLPKLFDHPQFPTVEPLSIEAQLWEMPDPKYVKIIER